MKKKKKCYLDSNVLVYFKNEDSPFFAKTTKIVSKLSKSGYFFYISSLVLDEFLFQVKYLLRKKHSDKKTNVLLKEILQDILDLPRLEIVAGGLDKDRYVDIVEYMSKFNLRPRDAFHLKCMKDNDISFFATFDKDFEKVFREKLLLPVVAD